MVSYDVINQIITLTVPGEILSRVVNDVVRANGTRRFQIPRAAHTSDFGPKRLRNLHRKRPHTAGRTIDENLLPGLDPSLIAKPLQSGDRSHRDGGSFLKRNIGWFQRQSVFTSGCILGESTRAASKHLIPGMKPRYLAANGFHPPGDINAHSRVFRFAQPPKQAGDTTFHAMPVRGVGGRRMNPNQHLTVAGSRFLHILELKNIR